MNKAPQNANNKLPFNSRPAREFWEFSVQAYTRPQVEPACICLQDNYGININLILLCIWCAQAGTEPVAPDALQNVLSASFHWRSSVIEPLRAVRRVVQRQEAEERAIKSFQRSLLHDELAAERIEQALMIGAITLEKSAQRGSQPEQASKALANIFLYLSIANIRLDATGKKVLFDIIQAIFDTLPRARISRLASKFT